MKYSLRTLDRFSLLAIVIICVIANVPYFFDSYYPVHDTLSVFQIFSYYYSELYFNESFPWWLPLTAFGMPIDSHILFSFGPFQYLTMALGYVFNIKNTLYLFSTSLAFDSFLLGMGTYLFCQHILKDRIVSLITVISIFLLIFYDRQIYWNFKILVPLPLVLLLVQKGLEKVNLSQLLWAGAILLCWSFGSVTYVIIAQVYVIIIFCLALCFANITLGYRHNSNSIFEYWKRFKEKITRREELVRSLVPGFVITVCLLMMYAIRSVMTDYMAYNAIGRGSNLGVDLKTFLTYGGGGEPDKLVEIFNGIPTSGPHDYLVYIGLINFGFVLVGLISKRINPSQIAILITSTFILAFTVVATGVAELAYSLPGMNIIRHIAYFVTIAKVLLIICAGFGIKVLLNDGSRIKLLGLVLAGVLCIFFTIYDKDSLYSMHAFVTAVLFIAFVITFWILRAPLRILVLGCVLISMTDMISYRIIVFKMADLFLVEFPDEFKTIQASPYRTTRLEQEDASVLKRYRIKPMDIYGGGDSYLREDFCKGSRQDIISSGVKELFHLRVWRDRIMTEPRDALNAHSDKVLKDVLGCGTPKIRFVANVRYVKNEQEAEQIVCCRNDIYDRPVIVAPEFEKVKSEVFDISNRNVISVKEFKSNILIMSVFNSQEAPLWLIYADAFDSRWNVMVDGKPAELYKANIGFKALRVESGSHEITLTLHRPFMNVFFAVFVFVMISLCLYLIGFVLMVLANRTKVCDKYLLKNR